MQVMVPQPLTAAQARWKSPNQLCKLLMHDLLLLRSSCMHCALVLPCPLVLPCRLVLNLFYGFCPLDRCVCSSLMGCGCSVRHLVPDMQTVVLGAFVIMVHAVNCHWVIDICTIWNMHSLHGALADSVKLHQGNVVVQGGHEQADDSKTASMVKEGSLEGAKTTLSNPVFQSAVDDVSDVEELQ